MTDERPSIHALPTGEHALRHPDGRLVLIRRHSPLRQRLEAKRTDNRHRHGELKAVHAERIKIKKAAQAAKGLPSEKSPI